MSRQHWERMSVASLTYFQELTAIPVFRGYASLPVKVFRSRSQPGQVTVTSRFKHLGIQPCIWSGLIKTKREPEVGQVWLTGEALLPGLADVDPLFGPLVSLGNKVCLRGGIESDAPTDWPHAPCCIVVNRRRGSEISPFHFSAISPVICWLKKTNLNYIYIYIYI